MDQQIDEWMLGLNGYDLAIRMSLSKYLGNISLCSSY
jgi:hypothetical protein